MTIENFTPIPALIGGVLIGVASALALALTGKIPGISGVFGRIFLGVEQDTAWRVLFVLGLVSGGALIFTISSAAATFVPVAGLVPVAAAGLLVGLGTRIGGGCTSGHGVCGIGRGSRPSVVATLTFMATAMVTVYVTHHLLGAASP